MQFKIAIALVFILASANIGAMESLEEAEKERVKRIIEEYEKNYVRVCGIVNLSVYPIKVELVSDYYRRAEQEFVPYKSSLVIGWHLRKSNGVWEKLRFSIYNEAANEVCTFYNYTPSGNTRGLNFKINKDLSVRKNEQKLHFGCIYYECH